MSPPAPMRKPRLAPILLGVVALNASGVSGIVYRYGWDALITYGGTWAIAGVLTLTQYLVLSRREDKDRFSVLTTGIYWWTNPILVTHVWAAAPHPVRYPCAGLALYGFIAFFLQMGSLVLSPRLRPRWWRVLVSHPSTFSYFTGLLGGLFGVSSWLPYPGNIIVGALVPAVLSLTGVLQSLLPVQTQWDVVNFEAGPGCEALPPNEPRRVAHHTTAKAPTSLRIVQLTDVHLGQYMSEARLRRVCELAVSHNPDVILLTGDYHTPESDHTPGSLERGLEPLRGVPHVYASLGNHDVESTRVYDQVKAAFEALAIPLLVNGDIRFTVGSRTVRVVGHAWPHRPKGCVRDCGGAGDGEEVEIHLLHSPTFFKEIDADTGALVLGGHTHGGQVGLLSLGLNATVVGLVTGHPDHSLWGHGTNRLWAHRGQGFRSFSCSWVPRLGVPPEYSVLHVSWKGKKAREGEPVNSAAPTDSSEG